MKKCLITSLLLILCLFFAFPAMADKTFYFSASATDDDPDNDSTHCEVAECQDYTDPCKTVECMNEIMDGYVGSLSENIYILLDNDETWNWLPTGTDNEFRNSNLSAQDEFLNVPNIDGSSSYRLYIGAYDDATGNIATSTARVTGNRPIIDYDYDTYATSMDVPDQKGGYMCCARGSTCNVGDECTGDCSISWNSVVPNEPYKWSAYDPAIQLWSGATYVTVQDIAITKFNGVAINVKEYSGQQPIGIELLRIEMSYIANNGITMNKCRACKMDGILGHHLNEYSSHCAPYKATLDTNFKGCKYPTNPCGVANYPVQDPVQEGACKEFGGAGINCNNGCRDTEVTNNLIYEVGGECFGAYFNWDPGFGLFQGNEAWNCKSAEYHATMQQMIYRWNLGGKYDPEGDDVEPHWFDTANNPDNYPDCRATGKSGITSFDSGPWKTYDTQYAVVGNVFFGQNYSSGVGSEAGSASHQTEVQAGLLFNVWRRNNTVVDAVQNYRTAEALLDDSQSSNHVYNASVFYGSKTPENDSNYRHCWENDPWNRNTWSKNLWGSSTGKCTGTDDVIQDPLLEEQDGSDWLFPTNMTSITWQSFRPKYNSLLVDVGSGNHARMSGIDSSDDCDGTGPCTSVTASVDIFYWPNDYIVIFDPDNMAATRTNIVQIDTINRSTHVMTFKSAIGTPFYDDWQVTLTPYKWGSKVQDQTTGWYGTGPDWGAIEYAGDDPPDLGSVASPTYATENIVLTITSRNPLTGVNETHDWSDWIVCTNGTSLSNCESSIVWYSYDTANKLSEIIPANTLSPGVTYYWTARTHNNWPYDGRYQETLGSFTTISDSGFVDDEFNDESTPYTTWTFVAGPGPGADVETGGNREIKMSTGTVQDGTFTPAYLYQDNITGDFDVYTKMILDNDPFDAHGHTGGIIFYDNASGDSILVGKQYITGDASNLRIITKHTTSCATTCDSLAIHTAEATNTIWLRLKRSGSVFHAYFATSDPSNWDDWTPLSNPLTQLSFSGAGRLGLFGYSNGGTQNTMQFDFMKTGNWPEDSGSPISVNSTNPLFFNDPQGNPLWLGGHQTRQTVQDYNLYFGPTTWNDDAVLDWNEYLTNLTAWGLNYVRLWTITSGGWGENQGTQPLTVPTPYARTGPGNAADGGYKYNLDVFNQAYFNQMRSRVKDLKDQDVYVTIMFYDPFNFLIGSKHWYGNFFRLENNTDGLQASPHRCDFFSDNPGSAIIDLQKKWVQKVVSTLHDMDNVIWEIANEQGSLGWLEDIKGYIKSYETAMGYDAHLIEYTYGGLNDSCSWDSMTKSELLGLADGDFVSVGKGGGWPTISGWKTDPPKNEESQPLLMDTDHIDYAYITPAAPWEDCTAANTPYSCCTGWKQGCDDSYCQAEPCGHREGWPFQALTRGYHFVLFDYPFDHYSKCNDPGYDGPWMCESNPLNPGDEWLDTRQAIGKAAYYTQQFTDLADADVSSSLSSTTYCLADPGKNYLVYQPDNADFTVDLVAGIYRYEWYNIATRTVTSSGIVMSTFGGNYSFNSGNGRPDSTKVVLFLGPAPAASFYVRPAGGNYGLEDGSSYANAWDGFSDIDWGFISPGSTLFVVGVHREQINIGASGTSGYPINIVSCTPANGCEAQ